MFLIDYGLPYFQMSALNARQKPFDGLQWKSKQYTKRFLMVANEIIKPAVSFGIGCVVQLSDFDKAAQNYDLKSKFNAFALCGCDCVLRADKAMKHVFAHSAAHIFEEGDEGFNLLSDAVWERGINRPLREPGKPHKGKPDLSFYVQLQAADYLAFELKRRVTNSNGKMRPSIRELLRDEIFHVAIYTASDIEKICEPWGIARL